MRKPWQQNIRTSPEKVDSYLTAEFHYLLMTNTTSLLLEASKNFLCSGDYGIIA